MGSICRSKVRFIARPVLWSPGVPVRREVDEKKKLDQINLVAGWKKVELSDIFG